MLADIFDAIAVHTYKDPKPYPRPVTPTPVARRRGDAAGRPPEEIKALLRDQRYYGQPEAPV